jgi:hypothetical protein
VSGEQLGRRHDGEVYLQVEVEEDGALRMRVRPITTKVQFPISKKVKTYRAV